MDPELFPYLTSEEFGALPESVDPRTLFTQDGNTYRLSGIKPREGWAVENVAGMRATMEKLKRDKRELQQRYDDSGLGGLPEGLTLAELQRRSDELDRLQADGPGDPKEAEARLRETLTTEFTTQLEAAKTAHQTEAGEYLEQIKQLMLDNQARQLLATKELQGHPEIALPWVERQVVFVKEDGKQVLKVKHPTMPDQYRLSEDPMKAGQDMGLEELLTLAKKDPKTAALFVFEGGGGSGANPNPGPGGAPPKPKANPFKKETWSVAEQNAIAISDRAAANRLRQEAGLPALVG